MVARDHSVRSQSGRRAARWHDALLVSCILLLAHGEASGQPAATDAGSFSVLQGGVRVGREVFTIRKTPPPEDGYVVDGTAVYPTRRLVPLLHTDSAGVPVRYEIESFLGDRRQEQLTLEIMRGRGSERVLTRSGESASEFRMAPTARLLDDDVFSQYYFIVRAVVRPRRPGPGQVVVVPMLIPRRAGTTSASISVVGQEPIEIAGQTRSAIHLRIEPAAGAVRDVWADEEGRVLRIAIPTRGLVATRDELPAP